MANYDLFAITQYRVLGIGIDSARVARYALAFVCRQRVIACPMDCHRARRYEVVYRANEELLRSTEYEYELVNELPSATTNRKFRLCRFTATGDQCSVYYTAFWRLSGFFYDPSRCYVRCRWRLSPTFGVRALGICSQYVSRYVVEE